MSSAAVPSDGSPTSVGTSEPKTVLLVDDTETVLFFEKTLLKGHRLNLVTAKNGRMAIDLIASRRPDLVLMDIQMPELNGIEACRAIKANPETRNIPVVMVTTKGEAAMMEEAFRAGCDDYITKPIDRITLLAKVKKFTGR